MAESSSDDWNEAVARWSRVCDLNMEAALRETGCSEPRILHMIGRVQSNDTFSLDDLQTQLETESERAAFLATLGRGTQTNVKKVLYVESNKNWNMDESEAAAFCVNLSSNTNLQWVDFRAVKVLGTVEGCKQVGHVFATNSCLAFLALRAVNMQCEGVRCLLEGLESNATVKELIVEGNPLGDEGIKSIAEFLRNNATLEVLGLVGTSCSSEGAVATANALKVNVALKCIRLGVSAVGKEGMERLVQPFSLGVGNAGGIPADAKTTNLEELALYDGNENHVESIAHMLRTNKSLRTVRIRRFNGNKKLSGFSPRHWKQHIFPALKENNTLKELDVYGCEGLTGEDVFESLMDLFQNSSTGLEKIDVQGTGLASRQGQLSEDLRTNKEYRSQLEGQLQTATTSGRVVLCGYGFAGKTEICNGMRRTETGTSLAHPFKMGWKRVMQRSPPLQDVLFGRDAYMELANRTRGFEVVTLHKQHLKSVWDFAGQKEYYALHDYVFPDMKNSYFLYVCSCRFPPDRSDRQGKVKDENSIKSECKFWMKFLASNSKAGGGQKLPRVSFVLTKTDTLKFPERIISIAKEVVSDLKGMFKEVLNLCEKVEVVNALSSKDTKHLVITADDNLRQILQGQKEYDICKEVRSSLDKWSKRNPLRRVLRLDEFHGLCKRQKKLRNLPERGWEVILAYLNDLGEIIFPKKSSFIVTDPSWFGIDILGPLINAFNGADLQSSKLHHKKGFVRRGTMEEYLKCSLHTMDLERDLEDSDLAEELINLMIQLELCFEKKSDQEELFVPTLFDDEHETAAKGLRHLKWMLEQSGHLEHLGRRLECDDRAITFLTPGFFPRLQVHLRNYLEEKTWTKNDCFEVGRNLIRFAENGMEVCVEYAGDNDDYIDILVRSSQPYAEAVEFIHEHVVQVIRTFCSSPQGCQGVVLVESVIRPVCVKQLHVCMERKPHSVLVSELDEKLGKNEHYKHVWRESLGGVNGADLAIDLLRGSSSHEHQDRSHDSSRPSCSYTQDEVLKELKAPDLPTGFHVSIEDVGILRRVSTRLNFTKVIPMKLHIRCSHKGGAHVVEGQPGRTITLKSQSSGCNVNIPQLAVNLFWSGVGAVGIVFGVPVGSLASSLVDLKWVQNLFVVPEIPGIDGEKLKQMMLNDGGQTRNPSEPLIVTALNSYLELDPYTQGLVQILNLNDSTSFLSDFQMHKVVYTDQVDHETAGAWVCNKHYYEGFGKHLRSVPFNSRQG